jgi:DNA-directed RNA polymerase subunit RPC12/RpoP
MSKLYECSRCSALSTSVEWDIVTLNSCTNRQQKRRFIPFEKNIREFRKEKINYKCPSCLEFIERASIKESSLDDDDIIKNKSR